METNRFASLENLEDQTFNLTIEDMEDTEQSIISENKKTSSSITNLEDQSINSTMKDIEQSIISDNKQVSPSIANLDEQFEKISNILEYNKLFDEIKNEIKNKIKNEIKIEIKNLIKNEIKIEIKNQIKNEIIIELREEIKNLIDYEFNKNNSDKVNSDKDKVNSDKNNSNSEQDDEQKNWIRLDSKNIWKSKKLLNTLHQNLQKSSGVLEKSSGILEKPSGVLEKSSGVLEKSSGILEKPSGILEKPSGILEKPSEILEKPSGVLEKSDDDNKINEKKFLPQHIYIKQIKDKCFEAVDVSFKHIVKNLEYLKDNNKINITKYLFELKIFDIIPILDTRNDYRKMLSIMIEPYSLILTETKTSIIKNGSPKEYLNLFVETK